MFLTALCSEGLILTCCWFLTLLLSKFHFPIGKSLIVFFFLTFPSVCYISISNNTDDGSVHKLRLDSLDFIATLKLCYWCNRLSDEWAFFLLLGFENKQEQVVRLLK